MKNPIILIVAGILGAIVVFTGIFVFVLSSTAKQPSYQDSETTSKQITENISSQQNTSVEKAKTTSTLKIKSESITIPFSSSEISTKFKNAPSDNKLPRLVGTTKDQMALIEISGTEDDIDKINMAVAIVKDRKDLFERGNLYMMGLIKNALPSWTEGPHWVLTALDKVIKSSSTTTSTTYENFRITLELNLSQHVFLLTIEKM